MTSPNDMEVDEEKPSSGTNNKLIQLPLTRIRTIMRSSPDLPSVSSETYFLIARATELFVQYLAKETYDSLENKKLLDYKALAELVGTDESLEFLEEIVPKKIKMAEYWKRIGYESQSVEAVTSQSKPLQLQDGNKSSSPVRSPKKSNKQQAVETIVIDD